MKLIELNEVDSTNSWIKRNRTQLSHGDTVTALIQTEGRGRQGHSWEGNSGMLPLSVLLRYDNSPASATLCAGLAVCRVLDSMLPNTVHATIKWPNDILVDGRKLCGILCESSFFGDRMELICGVGINLSQDEAYFIGKELPHACSLGMFTDDIPDRRELCLALSSEIERCCSMGFTALREEYISRCVNIGKQVRLLSSNDEKLAEAVDIAEDGSLICLDEKGERFTVSSGEVSVRGIYGYI